MALTKIPANLLSGVDLPDSTRLNLGSDNDLALFHTGGNGVIHNTTGALRIRANTLNIQDYTNEDAMITAISDGAVSLYHNNSAKLATTSSGVSVTGSGTFSSDIDVSNFIYVGGNDSIFAENNLRFKSSGAAYIDHNTTGQVINFRVSDSSSLDTTPLVVKQAGIDVTGNVVISGDLTVNGTNTILNTTTLTVDDKKITIAEGAGSSSNANESGFEIGVGSVGASSNPSMLYYHSGTLFEINQHLKLTSGKILRVNTVNNSANDANIIYRSSTNTIVGNNANALVVQDGGNIGIGTSSPGVNLDIESSSNNSQIELTATDGTDQSFGIFSATGNNSNGAGLFIQDKTASGSPLRLSINSLGRVNINNGTAFTADGLTIGTTNSNCELDLNHSSGKRYRLNSRSSGILSFENKTDGYSNIMAFLGKKVGIGTDAPAGLLTIAGTGDAIRVESSNDGAGGAQMDLLHFSASPADEDTHGAINFGGYYSGSTSAYGSAIRSIWTDVSGREGRLEFLTRDDSAFNTHLTIRHDGNVVIGNSTDERLTIGQTGTPGTNSSNWIRAGNGVDMMYNAASGDHRWEIAGTQHMILKASQTASTAMLRLDDTHPWIDLVAPDGQFWRGGITMRGGSSSTQAQCHFHMCRHADMKKLSTAGDYDAYIVTESANAAAYGDFLIGTDGTEAMRFHAAGQEVSIGNTGRVGSSAKSYLNVGSFSGSSTISICSSSSGYGYLNFADGTSGAGADPGYMRYNHNDNTFYFNRNVSGPSFSSDQFLKENIVDLDGGLSVIKSLRPRKFDWKKDNLTGENLFGLGTEMAGFIAQEVEDYLPNEVHGEHGSKGISPMGIIAHLVKAVQQLEEEIERLKG